MTFTNSLKCKDGKELSDHFPEQVEIQYTLGTALTKSFILFFQNVEEGICHITGRAAKVASLNLQLTYKMMVFL